MILLSYGKSQIFWFLTFMVFLFQSGISSSNAGKYKIYENGLSVVDFKNGLLRISVEKQKFRKVIDEVAEKTGIRIIANTSSDEDLTINFDYLPLEDGLKYLFRGKNYIFIYSGEDQISARLKEVLILHESWGKIAPVSGIRVKNKYADGAEQKTQEKMLDLEWEKIKGLLQGLSNNNEAVTEELYEAIKRLQETGDRKVLTQPFSEDQKEEISRKVKEALEEFQGKGKETVIKKNIQKQDNLPRE